MPVVKTYNDFEKIAHGALMKTRVPSVTLSVSEVMNPPVLKSAQKHQIP